MTIDFLHMLVTAVLATAIYHGMQHAGLLQDASKTKRSVAVGIVLFVVLFLLNLVWPYGSGLFL